MPTGCRPGTGTDLSWTGEQIDRFQGVAVSVGRWWSAKVDGLRGERLLANLTPCDPDTDHPVSPSASVTSVSIGT
jgi:hypothetical protein